MIAIMFTAHIEPNGFWIFLNMSKDPINKYQQFKILKRISLHVICFTLCGHLAPKIVKNSPEESRKFKKSQEETRSKKKSEEESK